MGPDHRASHEAAVSVSLQSITRGLLTGTLPRYAGARTLLNPSETADLILAHLHNTTPENIRRKLSRPQLGLSRTSSSPHSIPKSVIAIPTDCIPLRDIEGGPPHVR